MNLLFHKLSSYFYLFLCLFSTWLILGAIPALQLEGMFRQVDTQLLVLHALGGILYVSKGIEGFFIKEKIILVDIPSQIYTELRKIFVSLFENSGFKDIKISENVDFEKLYTMRKAQ